MRRMGNWSELPHDLLASIAQRIYQLEAFLRFGAVCKSWHAAAAKKNFKGLWLREQIPYLMLPVDGYDNPDREFYSLVENEIVAKVSLPSLRDKKCFESLGWLLSIGKEGDMSLLNPLTGVEIELPRYIAYPETEGGVYVFVHKFLLTSSPDKSSDFVIMLICGGMLVFWRSGDETWSNIEMDMRSFYEVTYYDGQFYATDLQGFVLIFDLAGPNPTNGRILAHIPNIISTPENDAGIFYENFGDKYLYIVESSGALLVIARDSRQYDEEERRVFYDTHEFQVYQVDRLTGKWEEIDNLGSKAIFLGYSATTLIETSKFSVFKANHIYYTDDGWCPPSLGLGRYCNCEDMGVYNLETGLIEPFYHGDWDRLYGRISPAVWVTPSLS